ncbi:MAG: glycine reductase [Chloroflexi bacterium]|nr:glycine reductase [Chloroflexota bacterium]
MVGPPGPIGTQGDVPTRRAVIKGVRFFLAHAPGLVRHGSKPTREIARQPELWDRMRGHLRSYEAALAYPPNQVFLGLLRPEDLRAIQRPWWQHASPAAPTRWMPHGELLPEEDLYGLLKLVDRFDLIWLEGGFLDEVRERLAGHPLVTAGDLEHLQGGRTRESISAQCAEGKAVPLILPDGRLVGCANRAHEEDEALGASVLLENLACLATATMATRTLLAQTGLDPASVTYVIGSGEEAIGDRYQRGGGNLAKAVAERCDLRNATGSDVKAFCCGPNHALAIGAGLSAAGVFDDILVIGGCSLAKLGMKSLAHLGKDMPILEDVLAAFAIHLGPDDGASPVIRLDALGRHTVGAQSSQREILEKLVAEPLAKLGLRFDQVDRYATELHDPEVTEPAGSGNVPLTNYRMIGGLAVVRGEMTAADLPAFVEAHGMPGFAPTQGHVASAVPFLGHAVDMMREGGTLQNTLFLAKGSLFLGRMTQMSDGLSFLLERHP